MFGGLTSILSAFRGGKTTLNASEPVSGYGKEYDDLFAQNPYRNLDYKMSGFQQLLGLLGFRTAADARAEDAQVNANEYDADIFKLMQQNEFNEPSSEAARARAAGMNPDLLGIGDVAEGAAAPADPNGMSPSDTDDFQKAASLLGSFAKGVYTCFSGGLSLATNLTSIKQMQSVIEGQNISNAKSMMSAIDEMIFGSFPTYEADSLDDSKVVEQLNSMADNIPDFHSMGFSSSQIQTAQDMYRTRVYSLMNDEKIRTAAFNRYKALSDSNKIRSEGFISESDQDSEVLGIMINALAYAGRGAAQQEATNRLTEANVVEGELVNRGTASDIQAQNLETLNDANFGAISANNQIAEQSSQTAYHQTQKIINEAKEQMYTDLKKAADSGNQKAQSVLYLLIIQDFAQFEVSGGIDFNLFKGLSNAMKNFTSFGPKGNSYGNEGTNSILKNLGFGADVRLNAKTK